MLGESNVSAGIHRPTLVFIHGDFSDGYGSWKPVCKLLVFRRRAIVVDRPGYGDQLAPDERFSIAGEAGYIANAVAEIGFSAVHLVGHSYGGLIALEMAITRPEMVQSLHLIEPPLLDLLPDQPQVRDLDRRVRAIMNNHADHGDEETAKAFLSMIGADRAIERLRGTPEWEQLCAYATRFARNEPAGDYSRSALTRLSDAIPVVLYTGERSHPALRLIVRQLANSIVRARLVDVAEAGHAVQMSGAVFVDALLTLVEECDLEWNERVSVTRGNSAGE